MNGWYELGTERELPKGLEKILKKLAKKNDYEWEISSRAGSLWFGKSYQLWVELTLPSLMAVPKTAKELRKILPGFTPRVWVSQGDVLGEVVIEEED